MLYEVVLELNSAEKKDCFQQKSIKVEAKSVSEAKRIGEAHAKQLGKGWHVLYVRTT